MRVNFVGDVCMSGIEEDDFAISDELTECFEKADINFANLESPLTNCERRTPYQPIYLKGRPADSRILRLFDVYSLANNHIMDFTEEGLRETTHFLDSIGKKYFGAGRNIDEACTPALIEDTDLKLAFIGFTRYNPATREKAGTAPDKLRRILPLISKLKEEGYFVAACPHWNYQWVDYPAPDERVKAKRIIDAGADVIVGAHPHIVQGVETYNGKQIFHSLGNFIFHRTKYSRPSQKLGRTFVLALDIKKNQDYTYEILPVFSDGLDIRLMRDQEARDFLDHLDRISRPLSDGRRYGKLFYQNSIAIDKNTNFVFQELRKDGGIAGVIRNLMRANKQDVKKRLYSAGVKAMCKLRLRK